MSEPASENSGTKEYILIAEDSPPNRKILAHLLKKLNYEVIECVDGQEAWDKHLKENKINLVAILSDIMMPNLDGIGLLKRVREQSSCKEVPFILITAVSRQGLHRASKKSERRWVYTKASYLPTGHIKTEGAISKKDISADC
jgi:two-component system chemotaxis response regulator CheY